MVLKSGDKAPEIELKDQNGKLLKSRDLRNQALVLFFYPKDDTPGCTAEACSFRDNYLTFKKLGAEVWGVSSDNQESHKLFAQRHSLQFPLLCDEENKLRQAYKVPKSFGVIPGRVTYVIDNKKIIRYVFNNLLNGPAHENKARAILEEIKTKK